MAKRAEKHYKCPQDIEWALDADLPDGENLLLLQSRPETVHSHGKGTAGQAAAGQPAPVAPAAPGGFDLSSITSSLTGPGK
jgi:pyruvate,water dikinase